MIQTTVFLTSIVLMCIVAGAFAFVAFNASKAAVDYAPLQTRSYSLRGKFFSLLLITGVVIGVVTTLDLPYAANRGHIPEDAKIVNVDGQQWFWNIEQTEFNSGDTVVFNVTASDVSHGLGVYDPSMRLIGQTQAMPGYSNALTITFDNEGEYKLMCMEYCGLAHHAMVTNVSVSE